MATTIVSKLDTERTWDNLAINASRESPGHQHYMHCDTWRQLSVSAFQQYMSLAVTDRLIMSWSLYGGVCWKIPQNMAFSSKENICIDIDGQGQFWQSQLIGMKKTYFTSYIIPKHFIFLTQIKSQTKIMNFFLSPPPSAFSILTIVKIMPKHRHPKPPSPTNDGAFLIDDRGIDDGGLPHRMHVLWTSRQHHRLWRLLLQKWACLMHTCLLHLCCHHHDLTTVCPLQEAPNLTTTYGAQHKNAKSPSIRHSASMCLVSSLTLGLVCQTEAAFCNLILQDIGIMMFYYDTDTTI